MTFTPLKHSERLAELADRLSAIKVGAANAKHLARQCHVTTEDGLDEIVAELGSLEAGVATALGQAILLERRRGA